MASRKLVAWRAWAQQSPCQCEVSRACVSPRAAEIQGIRTNKGTGKHLSSFSLANCSLLLLRTSYWKQLVLRASFPSAWKQGEPEKTQGGDCGPQSCVPRRTGGGCSCSLLGMFLFYEDSLGIRGRLAVLPAIPSPTSRARDQGTRDKRS